MSRLFNRIRTPKGGGVCIKKSYETNPDQGWYAMMSLPKAERGVNGNVEWYWHYIDQVCYSTAKEAEKVIDNIRKGRIIEDSTGETDK